MDAVKHMGEEPVGRLLWRYSIPAIAGFVAHGSYQLVDRVLVSRGVGTEAVAAVSASFPLTIVSLALGLLVGAGTGNRIAALLGKGDREGAERMLGQGVRLALINGIALAAITLAFTEPLLRLCGCSAQLMPLAVPFARISALGQMFSIPLLSMGNIMRVQGRPGLGLAIMASGNVINAGLAALAVFGLHWGVKGTALATSISQVIGCLTVVGFVQSKISLVHIRRAFLARNKELSRAILSLGAPMGVMQILSMGVMMVANHSADATAGTNGLATLGVLNTIAMFFMFPLFGIMQAMQPLVGFNMGAGRTDRVRGLLVRVLVSSLTISVFFSLIVFLFPGFIARMFSRDDLALIELVRAGLPWFVVPIALFGLDGTMSNYFVAVHRPAKAGLLMLGRQVLVGILFAVLPCWFGFRGMYYVSTVAALPFAVLSTVFLINELRRLRRAPTQIKVAA
jgi:putative MATE family efflux protein